MYDILIIGCGIVGAATAYALSKYNLKIAVLEKENDVAMGATRANSAIIHGGFDPEEGTLMAKLNVKGCAMAEEICKRLDVPYRKNGSLVVSFSEEEDAKIDLLYRRGQANGVPDLRIVERAELHKMEPCLTQEARKALYAPSAGIISPWDYCLAMAETAVKNGVELYLERAVEDIEKTETGYKLTTSKETFIGKYIINCAGVHSAEIHEKVAKPTFRIIPCKGQYHLLDKSEGALCDRTLFQCPSKEGKGVLVSPTVHGNLIVGPDALNIDNPDDRSTDSAQLVFIKNVASKTTGKINYRNNIRCFAGVRANSDQKDFVISFACPGFLDVAGIRSPGLSAAPAIGEYVVELLEKDGLALIHKENYDDSRKVIRMKELSAEEKNAVIKKNPAYGRVICRCETVTEGEIIASMHTYIPARTVDGVKRRTSAGMGRCQGGFCGSRVVDLLAREQGVDQTKILKDGVGSEILVSKN